jgi:hypothetical protein
MIFVPITAGTYAVNRTLRLIMDVMGIKRKDQPASSSGDETTSRPSAPAANHEFSD